MRSKELCHYTKKEIAIEKILTSQKIRFGLLGFTNDPKESKPSYPVIDSDSFLPRHVNIEVINEFDRILNEEWKLLCLSKHIRNKKSNNSLKDIISARHRHGYNRPRMWAQYAENHTGICFIFDSKRLNENIYTEFGENSKIFQGEVMYHNYNSVASISLEYSEVFKYGSTNAIRKHLYDNYQHYFLSKFPDWKNETEYRWIIHNTKNSPELVSVEGAIKAVLVGSEFPSVYEPTIKKLCKDLNISAGRMHWTNGLPSPNLNEIYDPK